MCKMLRTIPYNERANGCHKLYIENGIRTLKLFFYSTSVCFGRSSFFLRAVNFRLIFLRNFYVATVRELFRN